MSKRQIELTFEIDEKVAVWLKDDTEEKLAGRQDLQRQIWYEVGNFITPVKGYANYLLQGKFPTMTDHFLEALVKSVSECEKFIEALKAIKPVVLANTRQNIVLKFEVEEPLLETRMMDTPAEWFTHLYQWPADLCKQLEQPFLEVQRNTQLLQATTSEDEKQTLLKNILEAVEKIETISWAG